MARNCHECGGYGYVLKSDLPEAWRYGYKAGARLETLYPGSYGFIKELRESFYPKLCSECGVGKIAVTLLRVMKARAIEKHSITLLLGLAGVF